MKKKFIVKKNKEFNNIIENNKFIKNKSFVIYYIENQLPYNRYGISVSKKLGNAVFRNKYKRRIREIVDSNKKDYINHKDCIIILRREGINNSFSKLKEELLKLLTTIGDE